MRHELNTPPPGGWPVGTACVITHDPEKRALLDEVVIKSEAVSMDALRPIDMQGVTMFQRVSGKYGEGDWPSEWMRPHRDPDTDLHRETEREVSDATN